MQPPPDVELDALTRRLVELDFEPSGLRPLAKSYWSRAFAFDSRGSELVARVGRRRDFYGKDVTAAQWAGPALPIPAVHALEAFEEAWLIVSDWVAGTPIELVAIDDFRSTVPDLANAIAAIREVDPVGAGWGEWDGEGIAPFASWRAFLEAGFAPSPDGQRPDGWRSMLDARLGAVVDAAEVRLASLDLSDVPRRVVHADMQHGNVHVVSGQLSGIFDWGAAAYADPLYEPACFEFWQPWHPTVDSTALLQALDDTYAGTDRRAACLIHIAVTHIAWTGANLGNVDVAHRIADQLDALLGRSRFP